MDTNDISPGKPNKYSYLPPTYAQKDPFVLYPESYVYAVSGNPIPSRKPRPYLTFVSVPTGFGLSGLSVWSSNSLNLWLGGRSCVEQAANVTVLPRPRPRPHSCQPPHTHFRDSLARVMHAKNNSLWRMDHASLSGHDYCNAHAHTVKMRRGAGLHDCLTGRTGPIFPGLSRPFRDGWQPCVPLPLRGLRHVCNFTECSHWVVQRKTNATLCLFC